MRLVKNISDWKIKRDKKEYPSEGTTHSLWETDDEKFGIYCYYINEYSLMRNFCHLQILKNKESPQVVYDSKHVSFIYNLYDKLFTDYDWTDKRLLVLRLLLNARGSKVPVILINLDTLKFVTFDKFHVKLELQDNILTTVETFYNTEDKSEREVTEKINLNTIEWRPLSELTLAIASDKI